MEPNRRFSFDPKDKRLAAPALLALGLIAVALGWDRFPGLLGAIAGRTAPDPSGAFAAAGRPANLSAPPPAGLRQVGPGSSLYARPEPLGLNEFLSILGDDSRRPEVRELAKRFVNDFRGTPELAETLRALEDREKRGEEVSAAELVNALRAKPAFRGLVDRFANEPGAGAAFHALLQKPELKRLLDQLVGAAGGGPGGAPPAFLGARRAAPAGVRKAIPLEPHAARPARTGGGAAAQALGPGAERPSAATGVSAYSGPRTGPGGSGTYGAEGATPLDKGWLQKDVGGDAMAKFCKAMEEPEDPELRTPVDVCDDDTVKEEFRPLFDDQSMVTRYGVCGACFREGIFRSCLQAKSDGCAPAWDVCVRDAYPGDARTCVEKCAEQGVCAVPAEVLASLCGGPNPPSKGCPATAAATAAATPATAAAGAESESGSDRLAAGQAWVWEQNGTLIRRDADGQQYTWSGHRWYQRPWVRDAKMPAGAKREDLQRLKYLDRLSSEESAKFKAGLMGLVPGQSYVWQQGGDYYRRDSDGRKYRWSGHRWYQRQSVESVEVPPGTPPVDTEQIRRGPPPPGTR